MTIFEIAELKIRCVEIFVATCSRNDLASDAVFQKGEKLWGMVKETIKNDREELS